MAEPRWLRAARKYVGTQEVRGGKHNPLILKWWSAIRAPFTDDETPWCAGFVGGVLEEVGIRSTRSAAARSYENWGKPLKEPVTGCIVTFARKGGGHVGFVVGHSKTTVSVLGGNQRDMVNITNYKKTSPTLRVTSYRWPANEPLLRSLPEGEIEDDAPMGGPVTFGDFEDEKPSFIRKAANWFGALTGFTGLTYMTDWQVALVVFGFLFIAALCVTGLLVWLFGADGIRRWVRKQVW